MVLKVGSRKSGVGSVPIKQFTEAGQILPGGKGLAFLPD